MELTLPVSVSRFFRNFNNEMTLFTMYGVDMGIQIEPKIHQNVFQPVFVTLLATCFILICTKVNLWLFNSSGKFSRCLYVVIHVFLRFSSMKFANFSSANHEIEVCAHNFIGINQSNANDLLFFYSNYLFIQHGEIFYVCQISLVLWHYSILRRMRKKNPISCCLSKYILYV